MLVPNTSSPPIPANSANVGDAPRYSSPSFWPVSQQSLASSELFGTSQPSPASFKTSSTIAHPRSNPEVEVCRRMLILTDQQTRRVDARERWKALRETMQSLEGYCFLCSRQSSLSHGHDALSCPTKYAFFNQGIYDIWLKDARNAFHRRMRLRACLSCGMPETGYHTYERKPGEIFNCPNKFNTIPLVYILLHDQRYRDQVCKAFPQVCGSASQVGPWLFSDSSGSGASGIVDILTWYFSNVFNQ
jgi:hypothetical protein